MPISCYVTQTGVYIYLQITCEINKTLLTRYFMALFITLGLISKPSAKMLSLAQHADYAQHLSVYAVSCTVPNNSYKPITNMAWVRARLCKLQKRVYSTCSRK
jgi:hypothetical protein